MEAGLIVQSKQGRAVINTVDFDKMNGVLGFLSEECCTGFAANTSNTAA